jgi:hypothetical protein
MLSSITTLVSGRPFDGTVRISDSPIPGEFSNFALNGSDSSSRVPFLPYNNLVSPAAYRSDARITKTIPFTEKYKLFLTFDIFNLSNSWSPTTISTQMYTEAKGVLTLTPTAYGQGTADIGFPDGTQARRMQVGARFVF